MENLSFQSRLREERERIGVKQADAALLAGVSRNMWGAYERGEAKPGADVLLALMQHGFDLNYVLGGTRLINDEGTLPERERTLLERYRSTDDDGRNAVDRIAALEAMRVAHDSAVPGGYGGSPATKVLLHEPEPPPLAPKRPRKP